MPLSAADLTKLGTRQLLAALRRSCASDEQVERVNIDGAHALLPPLEAYADKATLYEHALVDPRPLGCMDSTESTVTVAQLKAELAKRPHVPTGAEARRARQEKALQGRNRGRRDR